MKSKPVIAIVGATGLVGNEMVVILDQLGIARSQTRLYASADSMGELYKVGDEEVAVEELTEQSFTDVDIALFATSAELSKRFVPCAVEAGAFAIDNSSYFRMQDGIPLVVPEVNPETISEKTRIIANPNCSTIQLVPVLKVVHDAYGLTRVIVSTYQSVSGAGKDALDELWQQTLAIFNQGDVSIEEFPHQIAFNCIPQIDVFADDGFTKEEHKIINESRKILGLPELRITATAVRVPVLYSHAESVNIETEKPCSVLEISKALSKTPGIEVYPEYTDYPMQLGAAGTDAIHVGRIRRDSSVANGLQCWIVADNVRKGAALNAVQIARLLIQRFGK